MATIEENLRLWNGYDWGSAGDEWSQAWGGSEMLWLREIYPRVRRFLPCNDLLEIAPGFGRWTKRLVALSNRVWAIDLAPTCVEAIREQYRDDTRVTADVNDGRALPMIADSSVDFAFSFDSLVHADAEAVHGYVRELARVLRPGAFAFLHHSNLGAFLNPVTGELTIQNPHWRAADVSAALVRSWCVESGIRCVAQETLNWGEPSLTDAFSLIQAAPPGPATELIENPDFMRQADESARIAKTFAPR